MKYFDENNKFVDTREKLIEQMRETFKKQDQLAVSLERACQAIISMEVRGDEYSRALVDHVIDHYIDSHRPQMEKLFYPETFKEIFRWKKGV